MLREYEYCFYIQKAKKLIENINQKCIQKESSVISIYPKSLFNFPEETYSNMCALCEKPDQCDYPDMYSGYEGALRCMAHNGGDVAWTKVIYVKRFFGLPVGVTPAVPTSENPADYRYFCPDGSKVMIDAKTKPCTWAARPWQGYMTNGAEYNNMQAIQRVC